MGQSCKRCALGRPALTKKGTDVMRCYAPGAPRLAHAMLTMPILTTYPETPWWCPLILQSGACSDENKKSEHDDKKSDADEKP